MCKTDKGSAKIVGYVSVDCSQMILDTFNNYVICNSHQTLPGKSKQGGHPYHTVRIDWKVPNCGLKRIVTHKGNIPLDFSVFLSISG